MSIQNSTTGHWLPFPQDRRATVAAAGLAILAYIFLQLLPIWGWQQANGQTFPRSHQNDFKHIYLGAWMLSHGQSPYDVEAVFTVLPVFQEEDPRFRSILPYVYLPFTGQVMRPLAGLSFARAAHAWMLVNHLLILAGVLAAIRATGWRPNWLEILLIGAALALNATIMRQNNAGQLNAVLFAGYAVVFAGLVQRWNPAAVGGVAAFLALFKLTPGILLIYFLCTRRWLHAAWMAGIGVVMAGLGMLLSGPQIWLDFIPVLHDMGFGKSTWSEFGQTFWRDPSNQSINSFLHHVMVPWEGFTPWFAGSAALANGMTVVAAVLILAGTVARLAIFRTREMDDRMGFALVVLTSLLVPSIFWDHYLVQALLPVILIWSCCKVAALRWLVAACVGVICLPVGFASGDIAGWTPFPGQEGAGLLVMSLKLWPTLILWGIACFCPFWAVEDSPC